MTPMTRNTPHPDRTPSPSAATGRRGSVLVVVLALLAALMLLGFLFFTLASQERENARYFTASEKFYAAQLSPDELFDFAMEQVIVGPADDYANSALWGGRYSLLASLVGDDLQPYNGRGVNVIPGVNPGEPAVDQDQDGVAELIIPANDADGDGYNDLLALNVGEFSGFAAAANVRNYFAKPDVGYTYPDMNSPFLAYVGKEPVTGNTVIIPSFHRPQYLRGLLGATTSNTWYTDPATLPYVLRPHAERLVRVFNYGTGLIETAPVPRFEGGASGAYFTAVPTDPKFGTPTDPNEGFWDWDGANPTIEHKLDADPDDDGVAEASYMDLDHPIEETPDGTTKFIPLFAITIYDLDGLLNLNAHGNLYGDLAATDVSGMPDGTGPGPFHLLSRSNEGRQRSEINAQAGFLTGPPGATPPPAGADTTQIVNFFEDTVDSEIELANREWWFVLAGRGQLSGPLSGGGKATQLYPGRWGEADLLNDALALPTRLPYAYPRPGKAGSDEAAGVADGNRGLAFTDIVGQLFPRGIIFPAPLHPEDHHGRGTFVAGDGKTPLIDVPLASLPAEQQAARAAMGRVIVSLYQQYWLPPAQINVGRFWIDPLWAYAIGGFSPAGPNGLVTAANLVGLRVGLFSQNGYYVDDPGETLIDPELARNQITDSIFRPDETAFLHASDPDVKNNGLVSRLLNLVPANFQSAADRAERRKRFTTTSSDLKAYTLAPNPTRAWEVEAVDSDYPNASTFPPRFLAPLNPQGDFNPDEPFRTEARGLLAAIPQPDASGASQTVLKQLTRKLSVNHVAAAYVGGDGVSRYLLRPVTPHPTTGLTSAAVAGPVDGSNNPLPFGASDASLPAAWRTNVIANANQQEWHARRDRQNMARDVFMLLYLLGEPTVADVTTTNPYTPAQLVEMAQFAVNLVDAMDPDDTITCFTFDLDPSSTGFGWDINDDGYTNPVPTPIDLDTSVDSDGDGDAANDLFHYVDTAGGRGMVYGVELQQLAFSEAMAVLAKKFMDPTATDHAATDWDDSQHRDFTFVELQN
ncbi:MAG: hypothetical protein M3552_14390, partial [Planctomycetota bacterium]|nr:hypothetical protein [Planctomycetota bacterium]